MTDKKKKIGLALSGGGYRAAAFHLGVFKKLKELKILDKIDILSTISGGSIIGVYYLFHKDNFDDFYTSFINCLKTSTIKSILFSPRAIFTFLLLVLLIYTIFYFSNDYSLSVLCSLVILLFVLFFLYSIISFSDLVEKAYKKIFFGSKKIKDLPDIPVAAINTTNLETGTPFTFSKKKMSDSGYQYPKDGGNAIEFLHEEFPISVAVSASTAVPGPFNPIKIHKNHFKNKDDFNKRANPLLVDGGVYDNQGIHKITMDKSDYRCDILICSDGSAPFKKKSSTINPFPILLRVNSVMMKRIRGLQIMLNIFYSSKEFIEEITYFSLDWGYENCLYGFMKNFKEGKIRKNVLEYHIIPKDFYPDNNYKDKEIIEYLKKKINYAEITKNKLSDEQINFISEIGTNLSALTDNEIELLSRHAEILTELQIKLYCPSLII